MRKSLNVNHTCPFCGSAATDAQTQDTVISVYGREASVRGLSQMVCSDCGEDFETAEQERKNSALLMRARDRLSLITPSMIRELRVKYNLTQAAAGRLFGGGEKAFAKYEAGTIAPREAAAKLLRLALESEEAFRALKNIVEPITEDRRFAAGAGRAFNAGFWAAISRDRVSEEEPKSSTVSCKVYSLRLKRKGATIKDLGQKVVGHETYYPSSTVHEGEGKPNADIEIDGMEAYA